MKTRFSTLDICAALSEIQKKAIGLRLVNVYDIDNKTYLFKLSKPDFKLMLLIESGVRIHLSEFDWPKNNIPSGFAMKMRKHLRGRRLVSATQLGSDRIIDLQFGSDEAAFHVFLELYDRGNIALADHQDVILNLLRYRKNTVTKGHAKEEENDDVRFAVHEPYPRQSARPVAPLVSVEKLREIFHESKEDALIKRILTPHLPYGAACIDHCLSVAGFSSSSKLGKDFHLERDVETLHAAFAEAEEFVEKSRTGECKGYIIQKCEKKSDGEFLANVEFHPFLFRQHEDLPHKELSSFNQAVDEFFSSLESQKNDMKVLQRERAAYKKLDNVRKDHESRLKALRNEQDEDKRKALIIENNLELVDQAIRVICSAIANQVNWDEIKTLVSDAQAREDPVAMAIKSLKLETNTMVMSLREAISDDEDLDFSYSSDENADVKKKTVKSKPVKVDINLSMTAYANAQSYYNKKRQAAQKEQRTLDASTKAFKSAEKKTKQTLKEAAVISNIQKARKTFWFEKFLWFVSSENYLVLGGRDAQQNEILVKKYLKAGDAYVHADLHGATSCIIKNPTGLPVPPKTLNEAGTMAICHSAAWDAKVITSAWWVNSDQVSKTAPSGEYLTTGSFMVRGKKNYLPPSYLIYGFGFLFKVDETCIWKHKGERKVRAMEDELSSIAATTEQLDELDLTSDHDEELGNEPNVVEHEENLKTEESPNATEEPPASNHVTSSENSENADFKISDKIQIMGITDKPGNEVQNTDEINENVRTTDETDPSKMKTAERFDGASDSGESVSDSPDELATTETLRLEYPDTHVQISYADVDKYQLESLANEQLSVNTEKARTGLKSEHVKTLYAKDGDDEVVYLGDNVPVSLQTEKPSEQQKDKPRMSAKQKRELKKQQRKQQNNADDKQDVPDGFDLTDVRKNKKELHQQQPYVRGQKKKLRRKNKDQSDDEDEKRKMMEMLQSAKPKDKKKKYKKQEQIKQVQIKENKKSQKNFSKSSKLSGGAHEKGRTAEDKQYDSEEEREQALKEENLQLTEASNALDSLTGIPSADDILLFAIPVCAPYNTMQNYKFKVKLTPGTGKKGKAAKTAISMFQSFRDITIQEKDHLRSVKDHDLSRNMPGKVKVSAPNLQKLKGKKK